MNPRILVVDDFLAMRRIVRSHLRDIGGFEVSEAADGASALEQLRAQRFDAVVSDIDMPAMNGFELLAAIKSDARLRHLPVVLLTAEAKKDEIVRAAQEGAADTIVKPFTRAGLEERLRRAAPGLFVQVAT